MIKYLSVDLMKKIAQNGGEYNYKYNRIEFETSKGHADFLKNINPKISNKIFFSCISKTELKEIKELLKENIKNLGELRGRKLENSLEDYNDFSEYILNTYDFNLYFEEYQELL